MKETIKDLFSNISSYNKAKSCYECSMFNIADRCIVIDTTPTDIKTTNENNNNNTTPNILEVPFIVKRGVIKKYIII